MNQELFVEGMIALGTAFNRAVTEDTMRTFSGVLSARLSDEQWQYAVRRALESETRFPPPAVLLRYAASSEAPPAALAMRAYAAIVDSFERGKPLNYHDVLELHGRAAAEAFMAAGGSRAFAWCEPASEPYRRRDFSETFVSEVEAEPTLALPEPPKAPQLPPD